MRNIRFYLFIFVGFVFLKISFLNCFEVKILDDIDSIIKNNKMRILLNPEGFDAIYKDNLIFSLDAPKVKLKNWDFDSDQDAKNIKIFKNDKKAFISNFGVQLNLAFFEPNRENLKKILKDSSIYISCLVVDNKGVMGPKCFFKRLQAKDPGSSLDKNLDENQIDPAIMFDETKIVDYKEIFCTDSQDLNISGTRKKIVNCVKKAENYFFPDSKIFLIVLFLLIFFSSLYFFIPRKKEDVLFRWFLGILLLSFGLIFFIKICLKKNYWPFDKLYNPESKSRVVQKND
jgi:hypothetical protein